MEGKNCPPSVCAAKNQSNEKMDCSKSQNSEKKPMGFQASIAEVIAAFISYPIAYYYVNNYGFPTIYHRWSVVVFTGMFWLGVECFCWAFGRKKSSAESKYWAVCMGMVAFAQCLWNGETTVIWSTLILHVMAGYWVLCRTGCLLDHRSGPLFFVDVLNAMIVTPFWHFFLRIRTIWYGLTHYVFRKNTSKKTLVVIITLLLMLPFLLFAINQLRQADAGFDAVIQQLIRGLDHIVLSNKAAIFVFSLFVGAYLYGLVAGSLRAKETSSLRQSVDWAMACTKHLKIVPESAFTVSLAAFCFVYLVFFAVQVRYLKGAFDGVLPANFTAAEFARTGFWQLCAVVLLNFALLYASDKFCQIPLRTAKFLKKAALILLGCNLLFAVVALCKIGVYVGMYGFTPRRVLASWFMLVLVAFSVLAILAMVRTIPAARIAVLLAAGMFSMLCIANPDWFIVHGNLHLYQTGIIQQLDTDVLRQCGADKDLEWYRRTLYKAGWIEGKSFGELTFEFGEPDYESENYACWNVGWNLIDPEILSVRFEQKHPAEPYIAVEASIGEGHIGPDA